MPRTTAILLSALLWPPSLQAQEGSAAGCYDLIVPPAHQLLASADSIFVALPPRIELDTMPGAGALGPTGFALRPAPGALPSIHEHAWWEWADQERLSLVWSTRVGGVAMELRPRDGGLSGRMIAMWSVGNPGPEAAVEALAVACDAPLLAEHRAVYRLPRGIELDGGDSIRVGEPLLPGLPGGQELRPGLHAFGGVGGFFGGAEEVRVATDAAGIVRSLRLAYPPVAHAGAPRELAGSEAPGGAPPPGPTAPDTSEAATYGELAGRFATRFGPASSSAVPADAGGGAEWSAWQDRMIGITFWNTVSAEGSAELVVMLRDPRF